MDYRHVDTAVAQISKKRGAPCGDAFFCRRTLYHTTLILADGIGSGVRAHVASRMAVTRLAKLLEGGLSLRDAFLEVVGTMAGWRDVSMPFAAFSVLRILNDGFSTVLSYEMPPPIFIDRHGACVLSGEPLIVKAGVAGQYHLRVGLEEGIVLVSDGIVQAGLGGDGGGWGVEGAEKALSDSMARKHPLQIVADRLVEKACVLDQGAGGDDKTVAVSFCRRGLVVDVLSGPPQDQRKDADVVRDFMARQGLKVVCGASSADMVARHTDRELEVEQSLVSFSTPPRYFLPGIDLVTEGVVTLNQAHNIIQEDMKTNYDRSAAMDLVALLQEADCVRFHIGRAMNPANKDIAYRKQGILGRDKIIPLIAEKLERMGKLVSIEFI